MGKKQAAVVTEPFQTLVSDKESYFCLVLQLFPRSQSPVITIPPRETRVPFGVGWFVLGKEAGFVAGDF